ncbi:ACP phosphodiesterase [Chitinophagaceae bacterium LWZ2-11]
MNYLAHAYLSFNVQPILLGNMISDFVKGKKQFDYSPAIQKGIRLHRAIDDFTDTHEATREAKQVFKPVIGLYAGAYTDIVYDYFLGNDKNEFSDERALETFTTDVYKQVSLNINELPERFQMMFPYMQRDNWLYNYHYEFGIERSFRGVAHRAKFPIAYEAAYAAFIENQNLLYNCYLAFFPSLKKKAEVFLQQLNDN